MRVDGVQLWPAGTCLCVCGFVQGAANSTKNAAQPHNSLAAVKLLYQNNTASLLRIRAPAAAFSIQHQREQHCPRAYFCVFAPPRSPQRSCMRARGIVPHRKLPRPTEVYRSVVCTYFCAALLWRILATVLETCSLSELLKGRAIRAVPPQLFTASYKTCHKHGTRRRH